MDNAYADYMMVKIIAYARQHRLPGRIQMVLEELRAEIVYLTAEEWRERAMIFLNAEREGLDKIKIGTHAWEKTNQSFLLISHALLGKGRTKFKEERRSKLRWRALGSDSGVYERLVSEREYGWEPIDERSWGVEPEEEFATVF